MKDENGNPITNEEDNLENWRKYFDRLLNANHDNSNPVDTITYQHVQPLVEEPTIEEVKLAISRMKNNKAAGIDQIQAELIKHGGEDTHKEIHKIIKQVWTKEEIPRQWTEAIICPVWKKGDKAKTENYRGISLLCTTYKVLFRILLNRLSPYVNEIIEEVQTGFRHNKSTTDHIFTLRQILEKNWEYNKDTFCLFVDFNKAYDTIIRDQMWNIMEEYGIPQKLINITKQCVNNSRCRIRVG
jgi:hypothetical protein